MSRPEMADVARSSFCNFLAFHYNADMIERLKWERVKAELAEWSPAVFAFETFLSLLLSYVTTMIVAMHWYQFIIMAVLTFATLTTGAIAWKDYRRKQPVPWEQQRQMAEQAQIANKLERIRKQLAEYTNGDAGWSDSEEFWEWVRMVSGYLTGVCRPEVDGEFWDIAQRTKAASACKHYLLGLITSLGEPDLRHASTAAAGVI
jgi:hypothetical protein